MPNTCPSTLPTLACLFSLTATLGCPTPAVQSPQIEPMLVEANAFPNDPAPAQALVSNIGLTDSNGDGEWRPGEAATVHATIQNLTDEDMTYLGIRISTENDEVELIRERDIFFVVMAGETMDVSLPVRMRGFADPGSTVSIHAEAIWEGCPMVDGELVDDCLRAAPAELEVEVGERIMGPELVVQDPRFHNVVNQPECYPGEQCWFVVTLANIGDEDDWRYPGVFVEADSELVLFDHQDEWFFGAFAGEGSETTFSFLVDETAEPGTTISFTAYATRLNCEGRGDCPTSEPVSIDLIVAEFP